ncbi:unnamed protein product [Ambrosiozyma monospora]|uniref:Unnamed protein product n=1 Tax=Ambrosiozyma monospora TaxID=43982 RepID=A0ACB5SS98_AMBMO|nr:unnamed protein product [Ambrosiozyma monospora]
MLRSNSDPHSHQNGTANQLGKNPNELIKSLEIQEDSSKLSAGTNEEEIEPPTYKDTINSNLNYPLLDSNLVKDQLPSRLEDMVSEIIVEEPMYETRKATTLGGLITSGLTGLPTYDEDMCLTSKLNVSKIQGEEVHRNKMTIVNGFIDSYLLLRDPNLTVYSEFSTVQLPGYRTRRRVRPRFLTNPESASVTYYQLMGYRGTTANGLRSDGAIDKIMEECINYALAQQQLLRDQQEKESNAEENGNHSSLREKAYHFKHSCKRLFGDKDHHH